MFRDTDEELRRLEEALLEEDAPPAEEELLEEADLDALLEDTGPAKGRVIYQNYSNGYGQGLRNYASGYRAYNADRCDGDLDCYSEAVRQGPRPNTGLAVLACLLGLGIVAVLAYWLVRYGGML